MQLNGETNNQDIISDITFLLGADLASQFKINDRIRSINQWQNVVWTWIFEAYGGWLFMDNNQSDTSTGIPYADQTITSGTALYGLPATALSVISVQLLPSSGSKYRTLRPMTYDQLREMGGDGAFASSGVPEAYILQGDILRLLPSPNFTLSAGLRVTFDAAMTGFGVTDTGVTPGFASVFHRILSIGPSYDYSLMRGKKEKIAYLSALVGDYERRIKSFYSQRYKARFPARLLPGEDLAAEFA